MAQASSEWQQLQNLIQASRLAAFKLTALKRFKMRRFSGPGGWLLGLTVVVAMLFWNWKLLLATVVGVFVMLLVYLMQEWDWQVHWADLRRYLSGSNRQLALAVGSGGVAAFSTYMAVCISVDSDSPWIASGAILQGFGTLATLILLVWQVVSRQISRDEALLNPMLTDLTDVDPLKRLIAVRQLTQRVTNAHLDVAARRQIADYFHLMLSREQEAVVRNAVLDGIQALDNIKLLGKGRQPFQAQPALKRTTVKIRRRSS